MPDVVLERVFDPPLDKAAFVAMGETAMGCLDLYRASWFESFLAVDGSRLLCRFQAPDAEAIRLVTRGDSPREKHVWSGSVHGPNLASLANVVVERSFAAPASMDELQAREEAAAWCLEEYRVTFLRSFFSTDFRRMLCVYQAPDAESVRRTQEQAEMPFERVWACRNFTPENILE
ncbi:DUF4242 domain-containing protein [Haliea sp. E17]|uniref:DUF4242 domain-containing protein n=1 Tax=Haliea sp. E17 TaxID=3401576 RepID=UPI003AAAB4DB